MSIFCFQSPLNFNCNLSFSLTGTEFRPKKLTSPNLVNRTKSTEADLNLIVTNSKSLENLSQRSFILANTVKQPTPSNHLNESSKPIQDELIETHSDDKDTGQDEPQDLSLHNNKMKSVKIIDKDEVTDTQFSVIVSMSVFILERFLLTICFDVIIADT